MVNGTPAPPSTTLVSGSSVSTRDNSSAVIGLGSLGQVFLDVKTDLIVTFDNSGVKIELTSGSIRVQKSNPTGVEVLTSKCNQIEVRTGEILVTFLGKMQPGKESQWVLTTGELKEWKTENTLSSTSRTPDIDYGVAITKCNLPAAVVGAVTGGTAAFILLIRDNNPASPSSP